MSPDHFESLKHTTDKSDTATADHGEIRGKPLAAICERYDETAKAPANAGAPYPSCGPVGSNPLSHPFSFLAKGIFRPGFFRPRLKSIGLVQWVQLSAELASLHWIGRCSAQILLSPLPE